MLKTLNNGDINMTMAEALGKYPKTIRKAFGIVEGQNVVVELNDHQTDYFIEIEANSDGLYYFRTKFFANRFFDKLIKKYNLKEIRNV